MKLSPTILIAEDSESDRLLIELSFEKAQFPFALQLVEDGERACHYLAGQGPYADRARFPEPVVLLTDLKMPHMDGFELLAWVRRHEKWHDLPIIVLTGSDEPDDSKRAMELGANSYILKDLLMRPPPGLFDAIQQLASPA